MNFKAWKPIGCDEEDAKEYSGSPHMSKHSNAERVAELHAAYRFDRDSYPEVQIIHVRHVESDELWKFEVQMRSTPEFYATEVKE